MSSHRTPPTEAQTVEKEQQAAAEPRSSAQRARERQILELVGIQGFVSVEALARQFDVTAQTIRSDVNRLSREGTLRRYHGGAGLVSTLDNATFAKRRDVGHPEKIRIGKAIAQRIPNHASLLVHYGTTMEAVATALHRHTGLLIVTNNISIVSALRPSTESQVILVGGKVSLTERCTIGEAATAFMNQFNVDFGLLSAGSIGDDGSLYEFGYEVAQTARAVIANARQVYLAADYRKFGRKGLIRFGHVREVSAAFTDRDVPPALAEIFARHEVGLHVV